ncbi:SDR family NAD(P)-dependent oxidoreductase [Streptomyces eurocidicus]|uniref:NAD(P)-dependent dehydrogenase (Short-subunit alcohol dehydrogenase family) n=2 Tax=Streptomyces eurocidicus TaxID=66423 RepID=A0A7W8BI12_STREU|nr:glucose 1-dehydrogenase [Streptomyces eurocidicus]MBB5123128.1 NAD(P)-dependent dehydrogenase (short-subunit alcohol dehydrogenase family) [Streptomyces eurocidicus]
MSRVDAGMGAGAGAGTGLLAGKTVLVSGASSGIGAASARVFAREGARVVLAARREERLAALAGEVREAGGEAEYVVTDVSRGDDARRAVDFAVDRFGRLDAAFNNAGIGWDQMPLHLMDDSAYDAIMDTNVRGVWNLMRYELAAMLENGGGSIVNNSSVGGFQAIPAAAPYVASKHAVLGLTKAAAAEYASKGVRVNAVAPGTTRSEIIEGWFERNPHLEKELHKATPQGRTAEPEEIAEAAAWLCSDRSSFVTGVTLPVDGGYTTV